MQGFFGQSYNDVGGRASGVGGRESHAYRAIGGLFGVADHAEVHNADSGNFGVVNDWQAADRYAQGVQGQNLAFGISQVGQVLGGVAGGMK